MKNLKDTVTTICGILIAISGAIVTMQKLGVVIPESINTIAIGAGTIATAVLAYFTGKNPDGTKKTVEQIEVQMSPKTESK